MRSIWGALAVVGMFGASAPAMANEWSFMTSSDAGSDHYYDKASLKRTGAMVQFWSREDATKADVDDDYPLVSDALEEFDCTAGRVRVIQIIDRDEMFQEMDRFDFSTEIVWNDIKPDTVAANKRAIVCK